MLDTVKMLNDLIQTSEDGRKGFTEAAREATTSELKTLFQRRVADCETAVIELQPLVQSIGGMVTGRARRGWARVKAAVGDADIAMLEAVEREEDKAKAAYVKALTTEMSQQIRIVVKRQHDGAVRNHDIARQMRNNYATAKDLIASRRAL